MLGQPREPSPVPDIDVNQFMPSASSACIDDFDIKSILGQGATGVVYKALQTVRFDADG